MKICVVGAGIVGTNVALQLVDEFPSANITVCADSFYEDTLSHGAAGIFRPGNSFRGDNGQEMAWIKDSYEFYDDICRSSEASKAGIMDVGGYIFSSRFKEVTKNPLLESLLPVYRPVTEHELKEISPGNNWKYGAYFQTLLIESAQFLPWGLNRFKSNGGSVIKKRINDFQELTPHYDFVVNCTGLGAKWLCNDQRVVPIRGQVFKVQADWIKMFYYGDFDTYVIPGRTSVTMGGCRQFDSFNENIDRHDSAAIWERCTKLVPTLKQAKILKEWVGLRPYRDCVRLEHDIKLPNLIHCYGHGGYGVTTASGTAITVKKLIKEDLRGASRTFRAKL